jgi:hypothetical protein
MRRKTKQALVGVRVEPRAIASEERQSKHVAFAASSPNPSLRILPNYTEPLALIRNPQTNPHSDPLPLFPQISRAAKP